MRFVFWSILVFLISLGACTKKSEFAEQTSFKESGEFLVGTDAAYAPFEIEGADKTISGFDIDLLRAIGENQKIHFKFVNTPWEGLFNQLDSGDRDVLISAITITDERKKVMDFSDPYFEAVQVIAVGKKSTVTKMDDLKNLKVGVQNGTTGDELVSRLIGKSSPNIKRFEGTPLALQELESGGVEAVVADNGVLANFQKNNATEFKVIIDSSFKQEFYGIAVKKGNVELLKRINQGLLAIKANGTYNKIYQKYFGAVKK